MTVDNIAPVFEFPLTPLKDPEYSGPLYTLREVKIHSKNIFLRFGKPENDAGRAITDNLVGFYISLSPSTVLLEPNGDYTYAHFSDDITFLGEEHGDLIVKYKDNTSKSIPRQSVSRVLSKDSRNILWKHSSLREENL